jgi:DNA-directed RNA polymerase subunit N (RpoN/RPB10)
VNKIKRNAIRCRTCGDEIESVHRHDFRACTCGAVAVDGGKDYTRRVYKGEFPEIAYDELTEYYKEGEAPPEPAGVRGKYYDEYQKLKAAPPPAVPPKKVSGKITGAKKKGVKKKKKG